MYTVQAVAEKLMEIGLIKSKGGKNPQKSAIEVVRRWIRNGEFEVKEKMGKKGHSILITEEELSSFIQRRLPGISLIQSEKEQTTNVAHELKHLRIQLRLLEIENKDLKITNDAYKKDAQYFKEEMEFYQKRSQELKKEVEEKNETFEKLRTELKRLNELEDELARLKGKEEAEEVIKHKYNKTTDIPTISLTRSEIKRMKVFEPYQRTYLINYLFQHSKPRESIQIELGAGETKEMYLKRTFESDECRFFNMDKDEKENFHREKRGEMYRRTADDMYYNFIKKNRLIPILGLTPRAEFRIWDEKIMPVLFGREYKPFYTNLKRKNGFINPITEETFEDVKEAVKSVILTVFQNTFTEQSDLFKKQQMLF